MIDEKLLSMLRCPSDGSQLTEADDALLQRVNEAISRGETRDYGDQRVDQPIDGGLINSDASRLYPVRGGIPTLVADQAIRLAR